MTREYRTYALGVAVGLACIGLIGCADAGAKFQSYDLEQLADTVTRLDTARPDWGLPFVYVVAANDGYRVLSPVDPHHPDRTDCLIQWHPGEQVFRDPCFGQTYAVNGAKLSGPGGHAGMDVVRSETADGALRIWPETMPWGD